MLGSANSGFWFAAAVRASFALCRCSALRSFIRVMEHSWHRPLWLSMRPQVSSLGGHSGPGQSHCLVLAWRLRDFSAVTAGFSRGRVLVPRRWSGSGLKSVRVAGVLVRVGDVLVIGRRLVGLWV